MLFHIYQFLTGFTEPLLEALLQRRLKQGKEDPARIDERKGIASVKRPKGKLLWIHGASVGESLSVLPLLDELRERLPEWNFLVTTGTVTSAQLMAQRLPAGVVHQYIPMDHPLWVRDFLDHWEPNAVLWMESELWPNMLHQIQQRRIPAALLNARMGPDSQKKWKYAQSLSRKMLSAFDFILTGAQDYVAAFKKLGARKVYFIGNLKFGAGQLPVHLDRFSELREMIGARRCIGFLQTHPGEERMAAEIFMALKKTMPDLLLIIAPRKNTRGAEIRTQLKMMGLVPALRTQHDIITSETDIYIADTIGEMGIWYSLCPVVVIGGSFVPHGGQNPIEGTHFGAAVFYGPHMFNFPEIASVMEASEAAERVETPNDLLTVLQKTFRYSSVLDVKQEKARALARQNKHIITAYADEIIERLVK
jgi:3-deoxy-D-manno-octulosonic-acid transferase